MHRPFSASLSAVKSSISVTGTAADLLGFDMKVGNIQLGVPVRVTRRNVEKDALSGYVFIYDGLYDVVSLQHVVNLASVQ